MADLWSMHLLGPDDIHAAPSFEEAERACQYLNAFFADKPVKPHAVVAPWKGTPERHADEVSMCWPTLWQTHCEGPRPPLKPVDDFLQPLRDAINVTDAYDFSRPRALRIVTLRMDVAEGILASAPTSSAAVPKGWALVPVKPTKFMMDAAIPPGRQDQTGRREFAIWQAMLAAAPQPAGEVCRDCASNPGRRDLHDLPASEARDSAWRFPPPPEPAPSAPADVEALRADAERWRVFMDALCTQIVGGNHPLWTSAMMIRKTPKTKAAALRRITKAVDAARRLSGAQQPDGDSA